MHKAGHLPVTTPLPPIFGRTQKQGDTHITSFFWHFSEWLPPILVARCLFFGGGTSLHDGPAATVEKAKVVLPAHSEVSA